MFIYLAGLILSNLSYSALAQSIDTNLVTNLDGKHAIENLRNARYLFNKEIIKNRKAELSYLPKPEYIFNKSGEQTFTFKDIKFLFKDKKIVSINGIMASPEILATLTNELMILDKQQCFFTEKSNQEYLKANRNLNYIVTADRNFFSSLSILNATVEEIATIAKQNTSKIAFELGLAKMRLPKANNFLSDKDLKSQALVAK
ncbi:hypothetical protein [Pedobacter mucosus]|uniref:hypothetical protein n=1 Tax=Pedobacter mucosus TaxID=2895286 RepID=UPI001EE483C6|nr:hypothetical protein [Pedobacter mucosus]UKT62909.1 hypothetical protein LOK61_14180 [Pedobacter mucosus]